MNVKNISILVLIGLFIVLCLQNVESVPVHFFFWSFNISKLLLLIITLVVGILIGRVFLEMMKTSNLKKTEEKSEEA